MDTDVNADWYLDDKKKNDVKEKEYSIINKEENEKTITLKASYEEKSHTMKITMEAPNIKKLKGKLDNLKREFEKLKTKIEKLEYPDKKNVLRQHKNVYDTNKKNFGREKDEKLANLKSIMEDPDYKEEPTPRNYSKIKHQMSDWNQQKTGLDKWYQEKDKELQKLMTPEK